MEKHNHHDKNEKIKHGVKDISNILIDEKKVCLNQYIVMIELKEHVCFLTVNDLEQYKTELIPQQESLITSKKVTKEKCEEYIGCNDSTDIKENGCVIKGKCIFLETIKNNIAKDINDHKKLIIIQLHDNGDAVDKNIKIFWNMIIKLLKTI